MMFFDYNFVETDFWKCIGSLSCPPHAGFGASWRKAHKNFGACDELPKPAIGTYWVDWISL